MNSYNKNNISSTTDPILTLMEGFWDKTTTKQQYDKHY